MESRANAGQFEEELSPEISCAQHKRLEINDRKQMNLVCIVKCYLKLKFLDCYEKQLTRSHALNVCLLR